MYPPGEEENEHVPSSSTPTYIVLLRQPVLPYLPKRSMAVRHAVSAGLALKEFLGGLGLRGSEPQIKWLTSQHEAARYMPDWVLGGLGLMGELPPWELAVQHLAALNEQHVELIEHDSSFGGRVESSDAFRRRVVQGVQQAVATLLPVQGAPAEPTKLLLVFAARAVIEVVVDTSVRGEGAWPGVRWVIEEAPSPELLTVLYARLRSDAQG